MNRPRIIISTDIGGDDPDDFQSLVHVLVYADLLEIEGIISSPPFAGRREHIIQTLDAYRKDHGSLATWGPYPTGEQLVSVSAQGAVETGAPGPGKSTEGSRLIVTAARKPDPRPLYILGWGSLTDVAQALHDAPDIAHRIRLYSIGSWNTLQDPASREYVWKECADLWWIENDFTFRGMYLGGDQEGDLGNVSFVEQHVQGHGALGDLFARKKRDIKMGDTPSALYLLSPVCGSFGDPGDPTLPSWGGTFRRPCGERTYWRDIREDVDGCIAGVNVHRERFLRDWQERMDRCVGAKQRCRRQVQGHMQDDEQ